MPSVCCPRSLQPQTRQRNQCTMRQAVPREDKTCRPESSYTNHATPDVPPCTIETRPGRAQGAPIQLTVLTVTPAPAVPTACLTGAAAHHCAALAPPLRCTLGARRVTAWPLHGCGAASSATCAASGAPRTRRRRPCAPRAPRCLRRAQIRCRGARLEVRTAVSGLHPRAQTASPRLSQAPSSPARPPPAR
jgi:hypothetical protein